MAKASQRDVRDPATRRVRDDERELRRLLAALTAVRDGNFRRRMTVSGDGVMAEIAAVFNDMVERNQHLAGELNRVRRVVGREGKLTERLDPGPGEGAWASGIDAANALVEDLVRPTVEVGQVLAAVAEGDLAQRMPLQIGKQPLRGEFLRMSRTVNGLVDQLSAFTDEVTRVAREVGTEGKLGGQARIRGVSGSWKDLTDSVNTMASRLTAQVRDIALVTTAVARGDLSRTVTVEVAGEMLELKNTVNTMVDQLSGFADEVTRVAREVGTEGRLGGQAQVEGVSGTWKDLTDSVNVMAGNLTAQVRDIAQVTKAVAYGDLSQTITVSARGEMAQLAETINAMTGTLRTFASEVTRVAREVGFDGRLGGQAQVPGGAGIWKDLTDSVNTAFFNLTAQVRDIAGVTTAVAQGDLSQKITVDVSGEMLELKNTVNTMVDQLSAFASEVTRVAREVGSEGILGGQARVPGVAGTWKDLTDSVNVMAGNLTGQVRNIAHVSTAVARGDLSQKITVDVSGEMLELKNTVNTMVDQLSAFASEVTRVAREVGGEGRLGGQARVVPGVAGVWLDLTDSVNFMAGNLTSQVRNIAEVTTAVARGDLSQKINVDARGEILEVKNTVNTMVDQLSAFADEVTRVAREVGTEGRLGGQAQVLGVAGVWRDLTSSVNSMAGNLTAQVRSLGQVTTAVARGDLSQKITVDARGEILELKNTVNTMVDQLSGFADEVTRVAREVGTEGRLGGQADVKGVSGTWKDLTESVNVMAGNLTAQVRSIADVTTAVATGDLSRKITVDARGEILELKETVNTMVDQLSAFADEVTRVAREVGTEGMLGGQARVRGVFGIWKDLTDNVNVMANNLTSQVRNIAQVATAVADGDLSQKITVEAKGEILELKQTVNTMVNTLRAFADEVTRVAREVGTEGILGGQAHVPGVSGTWKDLTDNVNSMADNLTSQVRNIAEVTTAVARGDLSQKIDVDARGELLELKTTINTMVDQMSAFTNEVTRVAREVGTEGILGGQAEVGSVSGTWKQLGESVNELAGNLTRQVRAIAEVATAVTRGDLSPQITVDASGEISELKDNINQMTFNLRETTRANREQDWLKTNLARISGLMQGRRDLMAVAALIMSELTPVIDAQHGAFFLAELSGEDVVELRLIASYGYQDGGGVPTRFRLGQSLIGQAALEKRSILVLDAPPGYIKISSGLGEATPANVIVLPVLFEDQLLGVLELASFKPFTKVHRNFLEQLNEQIGVTVNTIVANSRTEMLLAESQRLTEELQERSEELQRQQGELRHSNAELEDKAALLARQNRDIEIKNREIEQARQALEERAGQLALSSKYKSEFLANMSHELRTPLNSLLILAKLLADNVEGNLTRKQVEFAETIHSAGSDLLQLINDILDLSKVQAGKMDVRPARISLAQLMDYVEATIRPLTAEKGLDFTVHVAPEVPAELYTDEQRLQQVLRNLLSNAVKFTAEGSVQVLITLTGDIPTTGTDLDDAERAVAFSVIDTGIGIAADKLKVIFEAFQQADGTTSRRYGGTGLGLSISREIAWLLGGEIHAESVPGEGSTFTLYLPLEAVLPPGEDLPFPGLAAPAHRPALPARASSSILFEGHGEDGAGSDAGPATGAGGAHRPGGETGPSAPEAGDFGRGDRSGDLGSGDLGSGTPGGTAPADTASADTEGPTGQAPGVAATSGAPAAPAAAPASGGPRRPVLVVEAASDGQAGRGPLAAALAALGDTLEVASATGTAGAVEALAEAPPACLVLDLRLPDEGAWEILDVVAARSELADLPVVVHVPLRPAPSETTRLREHRHRVASLREASSPGALAESVLAALRPARAAAQAKPAVQPFEGMFDGERVLIVDDDVRNVFALTSVLEQYGLSVLYAENGREGIEVLQGNEDIAIVLMDVMMPEMDGYATTAAIRRMPQYAGLPIIALTAKAMKGDQEKSIDAGASDYVAKPVDTRHLLGLIRSWLDR